jgi:hypothetical protein
MDADLQHISQQNQRGNHLTLAVRPPPQRALRQHMHTLPQRPRWGEGSAPPFPAGGGTSARTCMLPHRLPRRAALQCMSSGRCTLHARGISAASMTSRQSLQQLHQARIQVLQGHKLKNAVSSSEPCEHVDTLSNIAPEHIDDASGQRGSAGRDGFQVKTLQDSESLHHP